MFKRCEIFDLAGIHKTSYELLTNGILLGCLVTRVSRTFEVPVI
jgi:hypothetical protein